MQKLKKLKRALFIVLFSLMIVNPVLVFAQTTTTPASTSVSGSTPVYQNVQQSVSNYLCTPSDPADGHDLERCINKLYRFGVAFGAVALVFFVVFAGYMYMTGGETGKNKAKGIIQNALVGMGLLLGSYVLLSFINPDLVVFKPIQPPIFVANELPTCEALGLGTDCVVESDGIDGVSGGSLPSGTATACRGGLVSTPSSVPHAAGASQLCKELADKMVALKAKTGSISWVLTSSISGTHTSSCHGSGNPNSGNCVDLALNGGRSPSYDKNNGGSTNPEWGQLCQAIASLGGVNFANEASNQTACQQIKPYKVEKYTSGPNLHINVVGN